MAEELTRQAHPIGAWTVGALLRVAGDSVQRNRTTKEGATHPDRNAQFEHINMMVTRLQQRGQPGIAVDTKKKELVGPFKNGGREWQPKGEPEEVDRHDFPDLQLGKVISSGVVDLSQNEGWVSVGIDHETAQFAGQAIGRWWKKMGAKRYPDAQERLITADGGAAPAAGAACGRWHCKRWLCAWGCPSTCATSHRGPTKGTRSSSAGSPTSPRIGGGDRW